MIDHTKRAKGIGGSDAAAVLGLSRYKTPYQLYLEKTGEAAPTLDNQYMEWGRILEPVIRAKYQEVSGHRVTEVRQMPHPSCPYVIGNLDGIVKGMAGGDGRVVEIKTARNANGWGEEGADEVPREYFIQAQHYMLVTGYEVADIAVLIGGNDFRIYTVHADPALHEMMLEAYAEFWACVESRTPPDPINEDDCRRRFGVSSRGAEITATEDIEYLARLLREIDTESKQLDEQRGNIVSQIMAFMGDNEILLDIEGKPLVSWKSPRKLSVKFDLDKFKAEAPETFNKYSKTVVGSRRFLLKENRR